MVLAKPGCIKCGVLNVKARVNAIEVPLRPSPCVFYVENFRFFHQAPSRCITRKLAKHVSNPLLQLVLESPTCVSSFCFTQVQIYSGAKKQVCFFVFGELV